MAHSLLRHDPDECGVAFTRSKGTTARCANRPALASVLALDLAIGAGHN